MKLFNEIKEISEEWFSGRNDEWLKSQISYRNMTKLDMTMGQIKHIGHFMYHSDAIFRENGIETGEYLDYFGKE
ncbi:MAG: hypothetical protein LBB61_01995 [Treponema sp.]|jgi:hypothetical protein|nr:hypothetical protein [Treponema sp.]